MSIKSLKSVLKFWQEIIFIISIGLGLTVFAKAVLQGYNVDGWDIFLVCFFVPLLSCLIGQFFWKNRRLASILSAFLGVSSFVIILMALYGINTTSIDVIMKQSIIMLIGGIVGVIAAITMNTSGKFVPGI
ncbi:uncharacterized membrane protein YjjP (DUF1212 family) [Parabacteroides sp. PFB2-12]|uniref:hypothetical protein n=1 Tax=unclassified Parabacteroides TaxID=2649774 RepID=UPI00247437D6|nr:MULTISPECIES: hypothetical protein [unclassified Parabacteroides]MDH6341762.1 uncharacterized membrane protein YjjP (DUF1212 family) [Parabacteroides sp. PM6-13]MDH6389815.1 uncharacterized membrane protein YjjP (DUF1212 family) [Parabacteroides sp. PFB2-12]